MQASNSSGRKPESASFVEHVAAAAADSAVSAQKNQLLPRRPSPAPLHSQVVSTAAAVAAAEAKATATNSVVVWREQDPLLFLRDLKKLGQVPALF
jgi:hypothetical protein